VQGYVGVVLAGDRSARMGAPKAALEWHGCTLLCRTVATSPGPPAVPRSWSAKTPDPAGRRRYGLVPATRPVSQPR
jgi:hypothetical protein